MRMGTRTPRAPPGSSCSFTSTSSPGVKRWPASPRGSAGGVALPCAPPLRTCWLLSRRRYAASSPCVPRRWLVRSSAPPLLPSPGCALLVLSACPRPSSAEWSPRRVLLRPLLLPFSRFVAVSPRMTDAGLLLGSSGLKSPRFVSGVAHGGFSCQWSPVYLGSASPRAPALGTLPSAVGTASLAWPALSFPASFARGAPGGGRRASPDTSSGALGLLCIAAVVSLDPPSSDGGVLAAPRGTLVLSTPRTVLGSGGRLLLQPAPLVSTPLNVPLWRCPASGL